MKKKIAVLLVLILTLITGGCMESNKLDMSVTRMINWLENEYGEEFEIDYMRSTGPGSGGNYVSYVATARRKDIPEVEFDVVYDGTWYDTYYREMISYRSKDEILSKFSEIFDSEVLRSEIYILLPIYKDPGLKYLSEGDYHDLMKVYTNKVNIGGGINLLVEDFDFDEQVRNIVLFENYLRDEGFIDGGMAIMFVKAEKAEMFRDEETYKLVISKLKWREWPEYYHEMYRAVTKDLSEITVENVEAAFERNRPGSPYSESPYYEHETAQGDAEEPESAATDDVEKPVVQELTRAEGATIKAELGLDRKKYVVELEGLIR